MMLEPVEVTARWEQDGQFTPRRFTWSGKQFIVESTGRQWEDEDGLHVLCMAAGGQVFELIFKLTPAGWWLRAPRTGMA